MEKNKTFEQIISILKNMKKHPESISEQDQNMLQMLYKSFCEATNTSEHLRWCVEWIVEKWHNAEEKSSGVAPYEVIKDGQNIVLDVGANEILKLITGVGGTEYNNSNAKIYVGNNSTAENASQTGVVATGTNKAYAGMDSGYPKVEGRNAIFRSSFNESTANFAWNEVSITNGSTSSAIALNRKVSSMGTKNQGIWSIQLTISLVA